MQYPRNDPVWKRIKCSSFWASVLVFLIRMVYDECNMSLGSRAEGGYLFTYKRENPGEGDNYFVDVYRFVMDVQDKDLELQTEETDGYMFATLDQIRAFAAEGKFLHYDSIKRAFEF